MRMFLVFSFLAVFLMLTAFFLAMLTFSVLNGEVALSILNFGAAALCGFCVVLPFAHRE